MRALALVVALGCGACAARKAPPAAPSSAPMDLAPGEVVTVPTGGLREYGLEAPGVIDVHADGDTLTVKAVALGETTLYLVDREGTVTRRAVRVAILPPVPFGHELADRLAGYRCIRLRHEGATWIIEGTAESDEERLTLAQLADDYASKHVMLRLVANACPDAG